MSYITQLARCSNRLKRLNVPLNRSVTILQVIFYVSNEVFVVNLSGGVRFQMDLENRSNDKFYDNLLPNQLVVRWRCSEFETEPWEC